MKTVREVGERGLIEVILRYLTPMPGTPVPHWDDVMAVSLGDGRAAVLNTDMLVWETDVPRGMTHYQAARKAVVMNFSDLAAKGVRPQAFLASIGIPKDTMVEDVEEMARGFEAGAREHGGYVLGGDTNEAERVVISGVAYGVAEESKLMKRDGASPGDIIATTGTFGDTATAFKILLEGYATPESLGDPILESVFMPRARVDEGVALAESGSVSASIDSSDGLAISLYDLSRSSGVGFRLERLPTSHRALTFAEAHGLESSELTLYGGEEYELIIAIKPGELETARNALKEVGCDLIELGEVTAGRDMVYVEDGAERPIRMEGWDHFRARQ